MNKFKALPPEPIACLGGTAVLDEAGIVQLWHRLRHLRFFDENRTSRENYPITTWYVDSLPLLSSFTDGDVLASTPDDHAKWEYEKAWEMLEIQPWMEGGILAHQAPKHPQRAQQLYGI